MDHTRCLRVFLFATSFIWSKCSSSNCNASQYHSKALHLLGSSFLFSLGLFEVNFCLLRLIKPHSHIIVRVYAIFFAASRECIIIAITISAGKTGEIEDGFFFPWLQNMVALWQWQNNILHSKRSHQLQFNFQVDVNATK